MEIKNHLLNQTSFVSTPNIGGELRAIDTIVIHYTAGASAKSSIRSMRNPNSKASAHIVIDQEGNLTQMIPFNRVGWHAGRSEFDGRKFLNYYSIGIEIDNAGPLKEKNGKYYSWFKKEYPKNKVVKAIQEGSKYQFWHQFTEAQLESVYQLCKCLMECYEIKNVLGHSEISPGRKIDPGPAFPIDALRNELGVKLKEVPAKKEKEESKSSDRRGVTKIVAPSCLNFRKGPSAKEDMVTEGLTRDTEVQVLEEKNGWSKISVEVEGWVASKFLKQ